MQNFTAHSHQLTNKIHIVFQVVISQNWKMDG